MNNFSLHGVDQCLPVARSELLSQVLVDQLFGGITEIWHHPGHVFITTDNGRKLFTFDCKPVQPLHRFSNSSLDIQNSQSPIINVILITQSYALVVERNGRTQWWEYTAGFDWHYVGNMELCRLVDASVVSVTYLPISKMIVWCERNEQPKSEVTDSTLFPDKSGSIYCIKMKKISTTDQTAQTLREIEVLPNAIVVNNCPACDVFALPSDTLFIRTKVEKDQITVSLVCSANFEDNSMFLGQERLNVPSFSLSTGLDFRSLLLTYLPIIIKMEASCGDLGVKTDGDRVVSLSSSGLMEVFNHRDVGCKSKVDHHVVPISFGDSSIRNGDWFLNEKHIGIIHFKELCLYSIDAGTFLCKWTSNDLSNITAVFRSSSSTFLTWILTPKGLLALKTTNSKEEYMYTSTENLPDDDLLQTTVLQLAHCHQLKQEGYDKGISDKLETLKQAWADGKGAHQSQIVEMLAPLVDEYWRLDNMSNTLLDSREQAQNDPGKDCSLRFKDELSKVASLPRRARESRLLWLSQIYPEELLENLSEGVTLDCEEVIASELPHWQALLGIENWDMSRFELVCRLLFLHNPEKLYNFAKCAESVVEQTVGVEAFVRRKHSLIVYKHATECLPLAETSCNPPVAAAAQGKLILASGGSHSVEQALKHLLHYRLWREAVDLVRAQSTNQEQLPCYLFITMSALAQNHSLSGFTTELFELMPSWKSFLSFAQLASMQPDIRQHQLSTSASDLFCHGDSDPSLGAVKPFLLKLIKRMDGI